MKKLVASVLSLVFVAAFAAACTPSSGPAPEFPTRDFKDSSR